MLLLFRNLNLETAYTSLHLLGLSLSRASVSSVPCGGWARCRNCSTNIIVILFDDLGYADLCCYGSTFHESPNLDKLAAQGMRFTQAYSNSPYCSPSRAATMTGRHPARLRITDYIPSNGKSGKFLPADIKMELPLDEVIIAEVLCDAGYATSHVGKWHLGDLGFYPEDQGFQINVAGNHSGAPKSFFWPYGDDAASSTALERTERQPGTCGVRSARCGRAVLQRAKDVSTDTRGTGRSAVCQAQTRDGLNYVNFKNCPSIYRLRV